MMGHETGGGFESGALLAYIIHGNYFFVCDAREST